MASDIAQSRSTSLSTLLETLTSCLSSAASSLPAPHKDASSDVSIEPPQDGISLLDTKSEILLSYLHNLVFLIIFQLRQSSQQKSDESEKATNDALRDDAVKKLVELRVFLDRGVRPLEGRLKYQVDKVVKAAEDAERTENPSKSKKATKPSKAKDSGDEVSSDGSEDDSDEDDMDEMAYRPNVAAFSKAKRWNLPTTQDYAHLLPTTERRREREDRRPRRSNVIDEFVNAEMSSAPVAEPSIGSTILAGGRETKTKKDRQYEADRARYEETNFVRLPKETKKRSPNDVAATVEPTVETNGRDSQRALIELNVLPVGRDDGVGMGEIFDKRRKKIDSWKR
ncbi:hypothetical protein N7454_010113 [Penicillium verhagenii]|nr:hypothetical protein N7454_010113 [Penicillium verhagenii]